ncbi:MAG: hypothetical protein ACXAEF_07795, partial [Candidatus Thorarchaeota archaeon]
LDPDTDDDNLTDGEEYYGWNWALDRRVATGGDTILDPIIPEGEDTLLNVTYNAPDPYRARFQTHPVNPDSDFDGIPDGLEKLLVLSPLTDDTDFDGFPDFEEIEFITNELGKPWTEVPDIWHYHDYDGDGVNDWMEFVETTSILMPDTDLDGLDDWTELYVPVSTTEAVFDMSHYNQNVTVSANETDDQKRFTSALHADTDSDGLNDYEELINGTNPLTNDTDFDGLSDYDELKTYTAYEGFYSNILVTLDPNSNDTDSDGINDFDEVTLWTQRAADSGNAQMGPLGDFDNDGVKNIFDFDSDSDGIYDGFEVFDYQDMTRPWYPLGTDPFDSDQNFDSVPDGYTTDYDGDGLADYTELTFPIPGYTYMTLGDENTTFGKYGHILNHTIVTLEDTDDDGWNDYSEISFGSDPLRADVYPHFDIVNLADLGIPFELYVESSSMVSGFQFYQEENELEFYVEGPDGTRGVCNITIPLGLLYAPEGDWEVLLDGESIEYIEVSNSTMTFLFFEYEHSEHQVIIRGTQALQHPGAIDPVMIGLIAGGVGVVIVVLLICVLKRRK